MTETKKFGEEVSWDKFDPRPGAGWRMPSDPSRYISVDDPYWGKVLDRARQEYGDPGIHFDTDSPASVSADVSRVNPRNLVFSDGTHLPTDRTVVYHDTGTKQDWAQNTDGTASLMGPDGHPGPSVSPAALRKVGDHYAPVNANGQQIGPQLPGAPNNADGYYSDPRTGLLTPKNSDGDYYSLGPDGKKSFFDKSGKPITEERFDNAKQSDDPAKAPKPDLPPTDEQQSGKAAAAVKKLQDELKQRFTDISVAEGKLSEVLLNAHATTTAGQEKLNGIQKNIAEAVNNPSMEVTSAAGEKAYLTFLRSQVSAISDLLASSSLNSEDQGKTARALAALYALDSASATGNSGDPASTTNGGSDNGHTGPGLTAPDMSGAGGFDAGSLGPPPVMPDTSLSDVMGAMLPGDALGADPMSALASMLPGALGGLGGAANPLAGLGGLGGLASPLAGLGAGLGNQDMAAGKPDAVEAADTKLHAKDAQPDKAEKVEKVEKVQPPETATGPKNETTTSEGAPPEPVAPPESASPAVKLPDGSTANARTLGSAQAVRDVLAGSTIDAAYKDNGMTLPPVGTPITNPVDPTRLNCGDIAMFRDHYEPVLSSVKGYLNGQVVPLSQVTSSPSFLGFFDPSVAAGLPGRPQGAPPLPPGAVLSSPSAPVTLATG